MGSRDSHLVVLGSSAPALASRLRWLPYLQLAPQDVIAKDSKPTEKQYGRGLITALINKYPRKKKNSIERIPNI
jgi:arginine utilization protein RocB